MSCGIRRILQLNNPITFCNVQVYSDKTVDVTNICMYSWSTDSVCWTNWVDYNTYINICGNVEGDFYLRVLLSTSFDRILIGGIVDNCHSICIEQSNPFLETFCDNENLFNPYQNLDCALQLQQQLADSIVCMFGIPIYYFKTKPNIDTADYTFKEYVLHNVDSIKIIKLMIPDGEMPSSNPKYTALDFDWQTDWDVEIGKTDFANAFGDTTIPNNKDFIYIPMMNRMWSINSVYDEKNEGLMWRSTTWKVSLIKYENTTNITIPDSINSIIDGWLVNTYEDTFGDKEQLEQERTTSALQLDEPRPYNNLYDITMTDSIRKEYSKNNISVIDYQYNNRSNVVAKNLYKPRNNDAEVVYQDGYCGTDGTLMFIIQTQGENTSLKNIITFSPIEVNIMSTEDNNYKLLFNGMDVILKPFNSYLVVIRWNKHNYTCCIDAYEYTHKDGVPLYMLRPNMYYFDENGQSKTSEYNLDYETTTKTNGRIKPHPCLLTNIRLYDHDLGLNDAIKESNKYITQHKHCVINDTVKPFSDGVGYIVK